MKSIKLLKFLTLVAIISLFSGVKVEKSETVLEYINDLFTNKVNEESKNLENEFMYASFKSTNTVDKKHRSQHEKSSEKTEGEQVQLWMRISSPEFTNKNKFPPVVNQLGDLIPVRVDSNYFRINDSYDPATADDNLPSNPLDFWFRVSKDKLYYARTKNDHNIQGSISFTDVKKDQDAMSYCVYVYEKQEEWRVCAPNAETRSKVFCALKKNLGQNLVECSTSAKKATVDFSQLPNSTEMEDKVFQPIILIPLPSKKCDEGWDYRNNGSDWECTCKTGLEQSPIDIDKNRVIVSPVTPLFQYEEVSAKSTFTTIDGELKAEEYIKIKYFKNALRIFHSNFGKVITLDGAVYIAEEIVFHTPAEHLINGKRYDMEMQVIHYGQTKGDISKQVVLSFMFEKRPGVYNKFIDDVDFFSLPNPANKERDITNNLFIPKVFYSSNNDDIPVMRPFSFYTYQGSLTFPPCTERTIHYVAADPIPIGSAPLQLIKEALRAPDMKDEATGDILVNNEEINNFRTTQPLNGRTVFFFDHKRFCDPTDDLNKPKKVVRPAEGHYEKINRHVTEFLYVNGNEPSGLPNSFVVSEQEAKGIQTKGKADVKGKFIK